MGQTTREIEEEIVRARNRLGDDLNALQHRLHEAVDWRVQFNRNPRLFVGAAFGLGLLAGLIAIPRRQRA